MTALECNLIVRVVTASVLNRLRISVSLSGKDTIFNECSLDADIICMDEFSICRAFFVMFSFYVSILAVISFVFLKFFIAFYYVCIHR